MISASPFNQLSFVSSSSSSSKITTLLTTHFISISRNVSLSSPNLNISHTALAQPIHGFFDSHLPLLDKCITNRNIYPRNGNSPIVTSGAKGSAPWGEDNHKALETVLKFYDAIKRRNLQELANVIGDECRCVSNLISSFHPFEGKKQVLELFSFLMKHMGPDIQFVVQPTLHEGMNIGVTWKLEWEKNNIPLGKGFSFYTCHTYQGKVVIRDMEMFMEPLLHIEPLRLRMIAYVTTVLEKIESSSFIKGQCRIILYLLLSIVTAIFSLCFVKLLQF
ncbi:hypothetical protein Syun_009751 [Stephania yunnanensis]|uniref:SnoaL-like domain-containing protein n=1 Tax=Stephania yunnanensis TaxID=152371 RepID=A0AAP0KHL0_9MAGN